MDYSEKFDINPQNYKNMMSYLGLSDENNTINYGQLKQEIIKTITELKNTFANAWIPSLISAIKI